MKFRACRFLKTEQGTFITNNSINDKIFRIGYYLWMCFYFSVLSSKHSIILLQKQGCRLYFHQATNYGKIKSKTRKTENTQLSLCSKKRKTRNYPCLRKNGKHAIILVFEKTENTQLSLSSKKRKTRNYPCVRKTENTQLSLCSKN